MTIDPEIVELLKLLGPPILTVVGVILSAIGTLAAWLLRMAWISHQKRMGDMARALSELTQAIAGDREANEKDHQKVWGAIQGLRAEIEMGRRGSENLRSGFIEINGMVKNQQGVIVTLIEKISAVTAKLEAVFRFVDAPKRATDP